MSATEQPVSEVGLQDSSTPFVRDGRGPVKLASVPSPGPPTASPLGGEQATVTATPPAPEPTLVDRYYLAWTQYQAEHGTEPNPNELSNTLSANGMNGRASQPISPSTLRRYQLAFRIYQVWAQHRTRHTSAPSPEVVARDCTTLGVTGQYNKPITPDQIAEQSTDYERRWLRAVP
ncbi:hypothetical protein [Streptomyces sp. Tue6028]|uniref:hypothetical protein n=1 Tax=Streptomyces sp. Tue6028 TaxID=2036037 RepID=UPI003D746CD6